MVTGAIKNKVDKIWTDIWAGGITNPLTVIEQLTYLMFIRSLDEKELATEDFENMAGEKMEHIFPASAAGQSMRWSRFKDKDSREIFLTMQQRVFPAIKKMKYGRLPDFDANGELVEIADDPTRPDEGNTAFARYMDDAMFLIPTPQVLQKIITGLEDLYTHDIADLDMQGDDQLAGLLRDGDALRRQAAGAQGAAHNAFSRGLTHGGNAVALLGGLLHQAGEVVVGQRNMSIGIDLGDHLRSSFLGLAAAKPAAALYESLAIIHHFSPLEQGISEKFILARGFNIPFTKFTAQEYILFTEV